MRLPSANTMFTAAVVLLLVVTGLVVCAIIDIHEGIHKFYRDKEAGQIKPVEK